MARILIIDDEPMVLGLLTKFLGDTHDVVGAESAAQGLAALENGADLVIADLHLPDAEGAEVVEQVRESDTNIPMITISGMQLADATLESVQAAGAVSMLKPFSLADLRSHVDDALNGPA